MKKLLLSLGTVAAIAAPVASVIACGHTAAPKAKEVKAKLASWDQATQDFITVGVHVEVKASDLKDATAAKKELTNEFVGKLFNAGIAIQDNVASTLYVPAPGTIPSGSNIKFEIESAINMIVSKDQLKAFGYDESAKTFAAETSTSPAILELDKIINNHLKSVGFNNIAYANIEAKRIIVNESSKVLAANKEANQTDKFVTESNFLNTDSVKVVEFII